ncbi:MAG: hypothetical protein P8J02_08490 [Yoonia sp.]|nr:hypothetical protein [Yoonia sp.]
MRALIVQGNNDLGKVWARHLERLGAEVIHAATGAEALNYIQEQTLDAIVLDLVLSDGSALSVADFANYSQPEASVVFVTDTTFFSDGSIFAHCPNARAFVETATPPSDLAAIVHHYGGGASRARADARGLVAD